MSARGDSGSSRRHIAGSQRHHPVSSETITFGPQRRVRLRLVEPRPLHRRDCDSVPRPCPYVGCSMNLYLDVTAKGSLILNFPDLEPDEMPPNRCCALDLAEHGGITLDETGEAMNVTRERVRQIETKALRTLLARQVRSRRKFETFEEHAGFPQEGDGE